VLANDREIMSNKPLTWTWFSIKAWSFMMDTLELGQQQKEFGQEALSTWQTILKNHAKTRDKQVHDLFHKGLMALEINSDNIPSLTEVNRRLKKLTGWQGVFVNGLEVGQRFYKMLALRQFPIGNFIRDQRELSYTPEPDIVHDLYGHLPFLTDNNYADFCQKFGEAASKFIDQEDLLRQFERFFWFTIEFGLIKTSQGPRIFGAGIASSTEECAYALSGVPEVVPFDIDIIRHQEFHIDQMQKRLFILDSVEQLYDSLDELVRRVAGHS
jgi:phenylalanine-4-hydroxylase